jgi:hypothetical protein
MQWSEDVNAGFSTKSDLQTPVNDDYKTMNFETQYYTSGSSLKMFRRLAKMRQSDMVILTGATNIQKSTGEALIFSRIKVDVETNTTGRVYMAIMNFGDEPETVTINQQVLPVSEEARASGAIVTVTSNVYAQGVYWPRSEIDLSGAFTIGPSEGIVVKYN